MYFTEIAHTHTHTPYILQKTHAHHIFYRRGDTAQNVPMRTYTPQSSIANTTCKVRAPHLLQSLLRFRVFQSLLRFLCSCESARTHTHHIFYRKGARTIYFTGRRQYTKHSYAHIHTAVINRKYSMQSACASPSSITAAFPLQLRRGKVRAKVRAWSHFLRSDR